LNSRQREKLQTAPSAVQLEHSVRAAQYRRNYIEHVIFICRPNQISPPELSSRTKKVIKPLLKVPSKKKALPETSEKHPMPKIPQCTAKLSASKAAPVAAAPAKILTPKKMPTLTKPRARTPPSPTPRSLGAIAGDMSSSEDEGEDEEKSRSDDDGWEADNERDGLGRLLNHTGRPGYVPQPGQQPYFKEGRRYWF
jgi:hypothetical protein